MTSREYYTCKRCCFTYMDMSYYFCLRNDTGVIEKYESLFPTVNNFAESILRGHVIRHYCKNCDKIFSLYQTGLGSTIFSREETIDFLKKGILKKQDKLLKTSVILNNLVNLVKSDASLNELNEYLEGHDKDNHYKINFNDYLNEKSFESMEFNMNDYVKRETIESYNDEAFNHSNSHDSFYVDLNNINSDNLDLKSLHNDLANHLNKLTARDLDREEFYRDIRLKFDWLSYELKEIEMENPFINYYGDDFNITFDGEKVDDGVCPQCGEEFYVMSPDKPCPQCGNDEMEYRLVVYD